MRFWISVLSLFAAVCTPSCYAEVPVEDEIAILEFVSDYEDRKGAILGEEKLELRKLQIETLKHMKTIQDQLVKEGQIDRALSVADAIKEFHRSTVGPQLNSYRQQNQQPDAYRQNVRPYPTPIPDPNATSPTRNPVPEVQKVCQAYDQAVLIRQQKSAKSIRILGRQLVAKLKVMQSQCAQESRMESAAMIRQVMSSIVITADSAILPAPESISSRSEIGKVFFFEITPQARGGGLYGTNIYTTDSSLHAAVIHSGVLKPGEKGLIKVTVLAGLSEYPGSTRNGITSNSWGSWQSSFKVESADNLFEEEDEMSPTEEQPSPKDEAPNSESPEPEKFIEN